MKTIEITKKTPKTWVAWLAMVLGLMAALEIPALGLYSKISSQAGVAQSGPGIGFAGILLTACALITGLVAYRKGERSWVLWVGLTPALLLGVFWAIMIVAEIVSMIFNLGF